MKNALAIDVGGTKIYSAIINQNGEIISDIEKISTPKYYDDILSVFKNIIKKYENEVDIIAFSTCGAVNNDNTRILGSTGNIAKGYPSTNFQSLSRRPVCKRVSFNEFSEFEQKAGIFGKRCQLCSVG